MTPAETSNPTIKLPSTVVAVNPGRPAIAEAPPRDALEQHAPQTFDYTSLLRPLRGRYLLVILLSLIGGASGGLIGWHLTNAKYRCEGLIRIAYVLPSVMHQTDQNGPIQMYDAFLHSEAVAMQSWRLIQLALNDPAWEAVGKGNSTQEVHQFASGLLVEHLNNTDTIHVTFTSGDPRIAAAAVRSIIDVYAADYTDRQSRAEQQRLKALVDRQKELTLQLQGLEAQSRQISKQFGGVDLERTYDAENLQLLDLGRRLTDVRLALATAHGQPIEAKPLAPGQPQPDSSDQNLSIGQIAMADPLMRGYLADQERYEDQLADLEAVGLEESNPSVVLATNKLRRAEQRVADYAARYRALRATTAALASAGPAGADGTAPPSVSGVQSIQSLQQTEAALSGAYDKIKLELPNLLETRRQLEDLTTATANLRRELSEVTERRDSLQVESAVGDRLEVLSTGEVPVAPFMEHRPYFAAAGALGGLLIPASLLIGVGTLRRRYRYADETAADMRGDVSGLELLGVLPALREDLSDSEAAADAAQCIHQFRARMQVAQQTERGNVYLVTSASPGEGKTSIAMALALSFAASGARTLLIDCDLVGRRLTHGLHAEQSSGVREAVATGKVPLLPIAHNLSVLPAGRADSHDACTIASAFIRRLTGECRKHFDVIFYDSGPILGSVETSVLAPEVDSVVFVVSRGQQPTQASRAVHQLRGLGARFFGVVFNRAKLSDFTRSYPVSSSMRSGNKSPARLKSEIEDRKLDFGPVVRAVTLSLPTLMAERGAA
jgi:Mrp family chromosome partitioning ATPase/uncharacterized protein involved in exopolysaccharide biosynthesis